MDEYSILKKKRKKNAFAATSLLISIALALLVLVGAVLILGKVDTKELNAVNDDSNMTLGSKADVTCVTLTKEMVFNNNLRNIKEAAISYFTNERLPKTVGDKVTITLKEMLDEKLVLNVIDSTNKLCFNDKTYVEVTKEENEYVMKIFLSCSDMEDYILVHLGCYDYCDSNVCEKKVEKEYEYEYKKTTACTMSPWSDWGNWKTTRETVSNLKKEDTKTETRKKEVVDTIDATKKVTYNCDKYSGYTLVDDKCVKETEETDVKDATPSKYSYNCDKYPGYDVVGDKCVKETKTKDVIDATKNPITYSCPEGYSLTKDNKCERTVTKTETKDGSYVCPEGFTLNGTKCSKVTTSTDTIDATPVYATKTVKEKYTCYKNNCTTKTVFTCPSADTCGNYPETSCEKVKTTCIKSKEEKYISKYTCLDSYTLTSDNKCTKTIKTTETRNATFTCPDGFKANNGKCTKSYDTKETINATANPVTYTCPKDYTKDGSKCYKDVTVTDKKDATKVAGGYVCQDGYTLNDKKCSKTTKTTDTKDAGSKTTYTCPKDYTKNNDNKCTKKTTVDVKTTYYRYATRTCDGGSTSIKWSTSKNDSILQGEGYKYTGTKRELKVTK